MPKFSVIVPVYNVETYLPRCIDSILAQTVTDYELILVDDGSKDNSREVCLFYAKKDSRIRVITKENGGVSSARNVGIQESKGDWIAFVDGDDYLSTDYLEKLYPDNCDLSIGSVAYASPDGSKIWECRVEKDKIENVDKNRILAWYEHRSLYSIWTSLFKAELIKNNNLYFDSNTTRGEDTIFMFRYVEMCSRVKFVSDIVYYYVQYGKNGSSSSKLNLNNIYALNYLDQYIDNWLTINELQSPKFSSHTYWTKKEETDYFFEILNSQNISFWEKRKLLAAILSLPVFYKYVDQSLVGVNPVLLQLIRLKMPTMLIWYYRVRNYLKRR